MNEVGRLRHVFYGLKRRAYTRETLLIFRAPAQPQNLDSPGVELVYATHENIHDLSWFQTGDQLEVFGGFLRSGHVGYLGYLDGRCVHRSWLIPGPAPIREHWSQSHCICQGQAYVHYCLTADEARGRGVFPAVLAHIAEDNGRHDTFMAIAKGNAASQKAAAKAGWMPTEIVTFTVLVGIRWQSRRRLGLKSCGPGLSCS